MLITHGPCAWGRREDEETASNLTGAAKAQLYTELASGAESGWDYSSRWFSSPEDLSTIRTTKVPPPPLKHAHTTTAYTRTHGPELDQLCG